MIGVERQTIAEQFAFYANGDLMFAEVSYEERKAFAGRMKGEGAHERKHGCYSDGSTALPPLTPSKGEV